MYLPYRFAEIQAFNNLSLYHVNILSLCHSFGDSTLNQFIFQSTMNPNVDIPTRTLLFNCLSVMSTIEYSVHI